MTCKCPKFHTQHAPNCLTYQHIPTHRQKQRIICETFVTNNSNKYSMDSKERNQEEFICHMTDIGMSENEAKAYHAVFMLKTATVRDVYELSGIPRNKIYSVLSSLEKRGFVVKRNSRPVRYTAEDIKDVFDNLRDEAKCRFDSAEEYLRSFYRREPVDMRPQVQEVQSEWAIETHLRHLLRRTKQELIILVNDTDYFKCHIPETVLKRMSKKFPIYPILLNQEMANEIPITCYRFKKEEAQFMKHEQKLLPFINENTILHILSDRKNIISISRIGGDLYAKILYLDDTYAIITHLMGFIPGILIPITPHN